MPPTDHHRRLLALEKVLQISRDMVNTANLDELLALILDRSMELLEAERASIFLYDRERNELFSKIASGEKEIRFPAGAGIAGAVATTRQVLNIPDAYADPRFNRAVDRKTGYRTRSILAVPLLDYADELVGVLEVLNKKPSEAPAGGPGPHSAFGSEDIALLETMAAQAGVVLQRARLLEHYLEKQRMEQSLQIARQIQQDLLPRESPRAIGFDISGWSEPADQTGGDIFDFLQIGPATWTLMLADATGHGIGPALVIAEARAMLRALAAHMSDEMLSRPQIPPLDILQVMSKVNDLLVRDLSDNRFVTCFFGVLDAAAGHVRYASAGQGPIIFYDRRSDEFDELAATAPPLGIIEGMPFTDQVQREMLPGDMMAVVSDGFFEAANAAGDQFGTDRICQVLRHCRDLPAQEIIVALRQAVTAFTGGAPRADDWTALIVRRLA